MNIIYRIGNLLDVKTGIIVHGCNAQGVMGAGVAGAIKAVYPDCFTQYHDEWDANGLNMGEVIWYVEEHEDRNQNFFIANGVTQNAFDKIVAGHNAGRDTDYNAVDRVFAQVFDAARMLKLTQIHIPLIGSGIGGGSWAVVEAIILEKARAQGQDKVDVVVHCMSEEDIPSWRPVPLK